MPAAIVPTMPTKAMEKFGRMFAVTAGGAAILSGSKLILERACENGSCVTVLIFACGTLKVGYFHFDSLYVTLGCVAVW